MFDIRKRIVAMFGGNEQPLVVSGRLILALTRMLPWRKGSEVERLAL